MDDDLYLLWLAHFVKLSVRQKHDVIARLGSARDAFYAPRAELERALGGGERAGKLCERRNMADVERFAISLKKRGIGLITLDSGKYPKLLKQIDNAPICLYIRGELPDDDQVKISVVGTRSFSDYGCAMTKYFSKALALCGAVIVSGMARGVDTQANKSALEAGGKTIAVLGSGVDICYPPENEELYGRIIQNGCLLSEFPPGTPPYHSNFPVRNRIISGLSRITLVIEAPAASGSLITADFALDQGRDVLCVPGNVTSSLSEGSNELIKQGAPAVTDVNDVLCFMGHEPVANLPGVTKTLKNSPTGKSDGKSKKVSDAIEAAKKGDDTGRTNPAAAELDGDEKVLYEAMGGEEAVIDDIAEKTGFSVQKATYILTRLEINNFVKRLPGQRFART